MITRYDEFRRIRIDMMNTIKAPDTVWEYILSEQRLTAVIKWHNGDK